MHMSKVPSLMGVAILILAGVANSGPPLEEDGTQYLMSKRPDYPEFIESVTRLTACKIPGPPLSWAQMRIPWARFYPQESRANNEEGHVIMRLVFDRDWCVRKATIVKSTGFPRLDAASLKYAMTMKVSFDAKAFEDGQPVVKFPIAWSITGLAR